ncbi:MAG TPA: M56 family metallopeptidase [Chitinophagaceae bacterium]|nr:M56 family metallopeptidase [Chitinophagaceae bacterium]
MFVGQSNFLQALGWALLNSLWQMALLWVIFQVIAGVFRTAKSSQKSFLAASFIIIGFAWFVYTFFSILDTNTPVNEIIMSGFVSADGNAQLNNWLQTMLPVASLVYLSLLLLPVFYFIRNYRYVQIIRRYDLSKADVDWRIFVRNVSERMGIKKPVQLWLSGIVTSPVTIGYIKPVILLPIAAINQLSTQQLEAVLLHELAHIRRYDYLVNLIIRFIHSILYFNPFVKALMKTVEREREKSCDEMVIQFQYDPHGYASALLMLEKANYMHKSLAVAASGRKNDLLHRIECMLGVQKKQVISFNKLAGLFAGLLCFIVINSLLIISKPAKGPTAVSSIADISSPLYFFTESDGDEFSRPLQEPVELTRGTVVNHAQPKYDLQKEEKKPQDKKEYELPPLAQPGLTSSPFAFANLTQTFALELKKYQEEQVKGAVEASKKILEEKQWRDVEKQIADAMSEREKALLKGEYEKELSQVDWSKMQDKLRSAYDQIDWNRVNEDLNKAIVEIKIDSLKQVYSFTINELTTLQKELCENNLTGIPDTDISLKDVEKSKKDIQSALNKLSRVKVKKIVRL